MTEMTAIRPNAASGTAIASARIHSQPQLQTQSRESHAYATTSSLTTMTTRIALIRTNTNDSGSSRQELFEDGGELFGKAPRIRYRL